MQSSVLTQSVAIIRRLTLFLLSFQTVFCMSNAAMSCLLSTSIGVISTFAGCGSDVRKQFPSTFYLGKKYFL